MALNCGILGLPNVGKSTLFNALTQAGANVANYPFCTVEPNVGIVQVPDPRLQALAAIYHPKKITATSIEFVDIAGLVKGASQGEGLGNQFLGHVRAVDSLVHVVRCFDDPEIVHVNGEVDPKRDIEIIETEVILKDLDTVEKRISRVEKKAHSGDPVAKAEWAWLASFRDALMGGLPARRFLRQIPETAPPELSALLSELGLLSAKAVLYVANVPEGDVLKGNVYSDRVFEIARAQGEEAVLISGKIESEIAALSGADAELFLRELGLSESGLSRLIQGVYRLLKLRTFFTAGEDEVRAWTIEAGTHAVSAAGKIHSDIARGFIRAEVMRYEDLVALGGAGPVREKGLLSLEGKDYPLKDGDVVYFRFNV